MKQLPLTVFAQIRKCVYLHARQVEAAWWRYLFEHGNPEEVVTALRVYQNEDGGFGNGLEPDCANPGSTPAATFLAYSRLRAVGRDGKEEPIIQEIMRYVENTDHFTEHGWLWAIPSNNRYPCQPWYLYPNAPWFPKDWPPENYVSGGLLSFILRYFEPDRDIYRKALRVLEYRLPLLERFPEFCSFTGEWNQEFIEVNDWIDLLDAVEFFRLRGPEECSRLKCRFLALVKESAVEAVFVEAERRLSKRGYTDAELDALVEELSGGNVWNEGFLYDAAGGQFCDLEGDGSRPMHSGELWWNLIGAITKLQILGEYKRLEECAPLIKNAGLSCSAGRNG